MSSFEVADFIEKFNNEYEHKHRSFEQNFWSSKMNLVGNNKDDLVRTKAELDNFLGDSSMLQKVRQLIASSQVSDEEMKVLKCFEKTFLCYIIEDPTAVVMKDDILSKEAELGEYRNLMNLGYISEDGSFIKSSSVQLRNQMRSSESEPVRKACYEGLKGLGPILAQKFCEIVKLRNTFAKSLGYECFYDMKVSQAEGFNKKTLFAILDDLELQTRPILQKALSTLSAEKGEKALQPYNIGYMLSGDVQKLKDPYFPFESAVEVWARSFAALGITYRGSTMRLDLCDRPGKYSNGFCHWPQPAWISKMKGWVASETNFTSLASPKAMGSGHVALVTLMHEGGHAAHFANVEQGSPLFSQERAPTSVAYAENQSMFLDSLVSDADWQAKYAVSSTGEVIPWEIIEKHIRSVHAYEVFQLRAMLAVPYFEKKLYELPDDQVTPEVVLKLADDVEIEIQGVLSPRPLMSVPHILADESAAYYHGYVLAEMSVHQTRKYFLQKYGRITDNENVGSELADVYWKPGNSESFMDLVNKLTGHPLSGDAWVKELQEDVEDAVSSAKVAYDKSKLEGPKFAAGHDVDLDMRILLVHGDEVIADSSEAGLTQACSKYRTWLETLDI